MTEHKHITELLPSEDGKARGPRGGGPTGGTVWDGWAVEQWSPVAGHRSGIVVSPVSDIFAGSEGGFLRRGRKHFCFLQCDEYKLGLFGNGPDGKLGLFRNGPDLRKKLKNLWAIVLLCLANSLVIFNKIM
ncbi:photosystem I reaction center subunit II [Striga asiatica]|uniref:Photosystem I reaction center subunit II n=1 Tax=Striga asiatica TaxID=4170 RepID=A0A5A7Q8Y6_STRAF|nr:photosystem I reaction center subunit II [Striga asiatica]